MDEPTIGLDPHQIQGIRKLINNLRGRLTVVLSSHILPEIERSCDRVIIINRGRVVASGTSSSLREEFLPGNRFELEIEGSQDRVAELLKAKGIEVEILEAQEREGKILNLSLRTEGNDDLGPQLIAAFSESTDCTLRSLAPRVPNLEEIFLAATKRSWEETIESPKPKQPAKPE